jgi:hypothetical protein
MLNASTRAGMAPAKESSRKHCCCQKSNSSPDIVARGAWQRPRIPPEKWDQARGPPTPARHGRGKDHGGARGRTAAQPQTKTSRSHCGAAAERRPRGRAAARRPRAGTHPEAQRRSRRAKAPRTHRGADHGRRGTRAGTSGTSRRRQTPGTSGPRRTHPKAPGKPGGGQGVRGGVTTEPTGMWKRIK